MRIKKWNVLFYIIFCTMVTSFSFPLKSKIESLPALSCPSYDNIIRELRENWQSPIAYLKKRGYIPKESAVEGNVKPKDASCNAAIVEDVQNTYTCDKNQKYNNDLFRGLSVDMNNPPNFDSILKDTSLSQTVKSLSLTPDALKSNSIKKANDDTPALPTLTISQDDITSFLKENNFFKNTKDIVTDYDLFKNMNIKDTSVIGGTGIAFNNEVFQKTHQDTPKITVAFKNEIPKILKDSTFFKNKKDASVIQDALQNINYENPKINVSFKDESFLKSIKNKLMGLFKGNKPELKSKAEFDFELDSNFDRKDPNNDFAMYNVKNLENEPTNDLQEKNLKKEKLKKDSKSGM